MERDFGKYKDVVLPCSVLSDEVLFPAACTELKEVTLSPALRAVSNDTSTKWAELCQRIGANIRNAEDVLTLLLADAL
jgi:hypothetical protein